MHAKLLTDLTCTAHAMCDPSFQVVTYVCLHPAWQVADSSSHCARQGHVKHLAGLIDARQQQSSVPLGIHVIFVSGDDLSKGSQLQA